MWLDIAIIVFACTASNHMGLIDAIEKAIGFKLPIVSCCKCASFWTTIIYGAAHGYGIPIVAISLLAAWSAVWLELFMGFTDFLYAKFYDKLYNTSAFSEADRNENNTTADSEGDTSSTMP